MSTTFFIFFKLFLDVLSDRSDIIFLDNGYQNEPAYLVLSP